VLDNKKRKDMKQFDKIMAVVEVVLWYLFIYCFLYCIKHDVSLFISSFVLLCLLYGAIIASPWFRNTGAWQRMLAQD